MLEKLHYYCWITLRVNFEINQIGVLIASLGKQYCNTDCRDDDLHRAVICKIIVW